jgi:hypothetical protein
VNVVEVDERESRWEDSDPRFRVYLVEKAHDSYTTRACDITGADVLEAIAWAQQSVRGEGGLVAVALVGSRHQSGEPERGLVWLLGGDLVHADERTLREAESTQSVRSRPRRTRGGQVERARGTGALSQAGGAWSPAGQRSRSMISSAVARTIAPRDPAVAVGTSAARRVDWRAGVRRGVDGSGIDMGSATALTGANSTT